MYKWVVRLSCVALGVISIVCCSAERPSAVAEPSAVAAAQSEAVRPEKVAPDIEPKADEVLRKMCATLAKANSFQLTSVATIEDKTDTGQHVQFVRNSNLLFRRPDRLYAEVHRGSADHKFWYKGSKLTILDTVGNEATSVDTPGEVGDMLDFLSDTYDIQIPLSDLLYADPYVVLTENVATGRYVGQALVNGRMCDHLLFTQGNVDWQIWIDAGAVPLPAKLSITYKEDPDEPQFEAVLSDWNLSPKAEDSQFESQIPADAARVELSAMLDQD